MPAHAANSISANIMCLTRHELSVINILSKIAPIWAKGPVTKNHFKITSHLIKIFCILFLVKILVKIKLVKLRLVKINLVRLRFS